MDTLETQPRLTTTFPLTSPSISCGSSLHITHKTSWGTPIVPQSNNSTGHSPQQTFDDVELHVGDEDSISSRQSTSWNTLDNITALGLSFNDDNSQATDVSMKDRFSLGDIQTFENLSLPISQETNRPFNRWVKNLERRATDRREVFSGIVDEADFNEDHLDISDMKQRSRHKKSSSASSFGFVTTVKSASISLTNFSIARKSRRTAVSSRQQRTDQSTTTSHVGRGSEDSSFISKGIIIDQAVTNRLLQRRRVLEELISTEESYIADVKFLKNVYFTLLASIPSFSLNLRTSINRNLNEILELHEELLGDLHRVVPHSEYTQPSYIEPPPLQTSSRGHQRWNSLDAVPENFGGSSWLHKIPGMTADPQVAVEVARVFGKKINRFFVYEEYGAKYEVMIKDVASAYRTMPQWEVFQRGLEALASSLSSINSQQENAKKSMTIGDLLVKPIQRVCRYPLLFSELLKQTPVCDCPHSHLEIENVLIRLREATTEINRATDDPRMKALLARTWLLQDRLVFTDTLDSRSKNTIRSLGHVHLCGVLHVSWQTANGIDGQYLVCILYRDFLLLASAPKVDHLYIIQACVALSELNIEELDNGRGLQCHTAPFSWKLVFECDHQLFEIIMSACSPKEELAWRSRLAGHFGKESFSIVEQGLFTSLSLRIKPLGAVFGKPGTIARRISIHRTTTVGASSGLCQVIIKNTNAFKEPSSSAAINRSQSLLTTNRIPVLAPLRAERARLEALLADVWSREILPFPGMTGRARSEHSVRSSASSMMRKLSVASIASNFTKRSASIASLHIYVKEDGFDEYELKGTPPRHDHFNDSYKSPEPEITDRARLAVIQDEKENVPHIDLSESLPVSVFGHISSSPVSTMRPIVPIRGSERLGLEAQRIITPPLRTSSANSVAQSRIPPPSMVMDRAIGEKGGVTRESSARLGKGGEGRREVKRMSGNGKGKGVFAEGLRNFFR